jgi:hypothetical protein
MKRFVSFLLLLAVLSAARATLVVQKFATDPAAAGWQVFGDTALFQWDATNHNLAVTWDSTRTNSYFYHPLGGTFTKTNDFLVQFDLRLADIAIGVDPTMPLTFEIALGLINTNNATSPSFVRGAGTAPNLAEFTYFPNDIYDDGAVSTLFISSSNNYSGGGFANLLVLPTNTVLTVTMTYLAANQTLHTAVRTNGVRIGPIPDSYLGAGFDDFVVNALSVNSYNDAGQFPGFEGSVLAHGTVDNLVFASPLPLNSVSGAFAAGHWQTQFKSDTNWLYTLQVTTNGLAWADISAVTPGNGGVLTLTDTNAVTGKSYYRVTAQLP